ncbi:MAG: ParA family protein [Roseiarcus sp.]
MKTIAFFNNKGGVGKTSLVYHIAWMISELGAPVLAADFDPQTNLTTMCFSEEVLEEMYDRPDRRTVAASIAPLKRGIGDLEFFEATHVGDRFWLVPGDLGLSDIEDELVKCWSECVDRQERAFRVTAALHRVVEYSAAHCGAEFVLIDVGPDFGALNRAALIAADHVVIPATPDLFSVQGLENVGSRLRTWRSEWQDRRQRAPTLDFALPAGEMRPLGYVVSRLTTFARGPVYSFERWIDRIPAAYRGSVDPAPDLSDDQLSLGLLKDYRSLIAMAQEARKPMFKLKPGDGAIGGHQAAVAGAYADFEALTRSILTRAGVRLPTLRAPRIAE